MTKNELLLKLKKMKIDSNRYSLEGENRPDTIVFEEEYNNFYVYYFDEKGNKNDKKKFDTVNDAYNYVFKLFKDAIEIEKKFKIKVL